MLPGERIAVKGMGDSVVLSGTATSDGVAAKARDIARRFVAGDGNVISMVRVTSEQQVLLRVRVAEAKKSVLKELGVDNLLSPQTLGPLTISAATSALGLGPNAAGVVGIQTADTASTISLLEQQGYIRTLAEPNLLAVSGETASMLAGGEYPIPIAQQNGTISVQYKPFGVILAFLPVVLDSGRISLRIGTEVSAVSDQNTVSAAGFTFKSFVTRRANSVVELPSGGEIMIAGLLQNDITGSLNGVPGLMNLPILGSLFRSTSFQRNETELVILVSVILAKPADPKLFALPTDGFAPASDLDRYFLGHLQDIYIKKPPQGPTAPQSLQGPLGYIVQ
ncbi:MAG TPA: type II and III secretion system protein family protein, partial [Dongiaceae bacterium]